MGIHHLIPAQFDTERLNIVSLNSAEISEDLTERTKDILSPEVTKSLPPGWQTIDTTIKVRQWLKDRVNESLVLRVNLQSSAALIGFVFCHIDEGNNDQCSIRFGYLLHAESWGQGLGTELVHGIVEWAKTKRVIKSISGGVEKSNIGSIKVLEKVGFRKLDEDTSDTVFYEYLIR